MELGTVLRDRLERFLSPDVHLRWGRGKGANGTIDVCAMQAVAWLAGWRNTDHPDCACPVIGRFVIRINDSELFGRHRDALKPYCPRIVGTRSSRAVERRRAIVAADFAIRRFAPCAFRALDVPASAARLAAIAPVADVDTAIYQWIATRNDHALIVHLASVAGKMAAADPESFRAIYSYPYTFVNAGVILDSAGSVVESEAVRADLRSLALECLDAMLAV